MKNATSQYLYSVFRQAMHEFRYYGNKFAQMLLRTPLPRVLVACIALALLITVIPLVVTLFVAFLLLKIMLVLLVMILRQNKRQPSQVEFIYEPSDKK